MTIIERLAATGKATIINNELFKLDKGAYTFTTVGKVYEFTITLASTPIYNAELFTKLYNEYTELHDITPDQITGLKYNK